MPRTTIDLDASVLRQLRRLQSYDRRPLSELVNQLLARALAETEVGEWSGRPLPWTARGMAARVDLEDKEAVRRALDEP